MLWTTCTGFPSYRSIRRGSRCHRTFGRRGYCYVQGCYVVLISRLGKSCWSLMTPITSTRNRVILLVDWALNTGRTSIVPMKTNRANLRHISLPSVPYPPLPPLIYFSVFVPFPTMGLGKLTTHFMTLPQRRPPTFLKHFTCIYKSVHKTL